jgi:hypothetical protein
VFLEAILFPHDLPTRLANTPTTAMTIIKLIIELELDFFNAILFISEFILLYATFQLGVIMMIWLKIYQEAKASRHGGRSPGACFRASA